MSAKSEDLESSRRIIERCASVLVKALRNAPISCAGYVSIELDRGEECEGWVLRSHDEEPARRAALPKDARPVLRIQADEALLIQALKQGKEPREVMIAAQVRLTGHPDMLTYLFTHSATLLPRLAASSRKEA